jgi:hypothetical protein
LRGLHPWSGFKKPDQASFNTIFKIFAHGLRKGSTYSHTISKVVHSAKDVEDWILPLAEAGVDIFHASQRRFWEPALPGSDLNLAGWLKQVSGKPTITVGSVGLSGDMTELFMQGQGAGKKDLGELVRRFRFSGRGPCHSARPPVAQKNKRTPVRRIEGL